MDDVKDNTGGNSAAGVIEPPPGAGIPADVPPPADAGDKTEGEGDKSQSTEGGGKGKIKLPPSIKPPVKTGRFQARISDLVGQRDNAEREAQQLRERLSRMQSIPKTGGKVADRDIPAAEDDPNAPLDPEKFETYGEYVTALVERTLEQKKQSERSEQAQEAFERHRQERISTFNEQAAPLATAYGEGFWDAITDPDLPVTEAMADAVLELDELGPYTMLYLAAHRDEATKIARMNPRAATIAVGRLAAKLDFEIKQGGEGVGAATAIGDSMQTGPAPAGAVAMAPKPSPVPTPRGSAPALDAAPSDKDSVEEWLRKETDRLRRVNPNARFYGAR